MLFRSAIADAIQSGGGADKLFPHQRMAYDALNAPYAKKRTVQVDASKATFADDVSVRREPSGHVFAGSAVLLGRCENVRCMCAETSRAAQFAKDCSNLIPPAPMVAAQPAGHCVITELGVVTGMCDKAYCTCLDSPAGYKCSSDRVRACPHFTACSAEGVFAPKPKQEPPHRVSLISKDKQEGYTLAEQGKVIGHCICKAHNGCQCVPTTIPRSALEACCYFVPKGEAK